MSNKSTRNKAITKILEFYPDALVISSAGYTSRALYEVNDNPRHFYMMGSMGCAVGFGIGLAMNTYKDVVVIVGDGEVLMGLSSLVLANKLHLDNLYIYVLDNNQYQSTGGQSTCSEYIPEFDCITQVIPIDDDHVPPRIQLSPSEISDRFHNEVKK